MATYGLIGINLKVRRTIGDARRYVIDCKAPLLLENGPSGPSGPFIPQPSKNTGLPVDRFPPWYQLKPVQDVAAKAVHTAPPSAAESWTAFAASPGPVLPTEPVHKNGLQAQQNQGRGPEGPEGPEIYTIVPLRVTPHADVDVPLPGAPPVPGCPQCRAHDWLLLVTSRQCRQCGYRDGPTAEEILAQH